MLALCKQLEHAGVEFIVIACNTVHKVLPLIQDEVSLPIVHIVDATRERIQDLGLTKVGLIGSPLTMTDEYFAGRLADNGVDVVVPGEEDRKMIHRALGEEFAVGVFLAETRESFKGVIDRLVERGAEGVVLGCTEFGILLQEEDRSLDVVLIDTAVVHCEVAVRMALA
ncbi:Asp/Glu/hydantoin racemase [Aspergillus karnatakaensis]|uniref:aspartate/glutamate racemase family protein n=1 Tax=Aspergillus karnatakaensis TaxID=1810916 RepID=UPI003CCD8363